jgi:hypothetical protein
MCSACHVVGLALSPPHRNEELCRTQNGERQQPKLERKRYGDDSPHDLTRRHA